jgi:hypothetical protein
MESEKNIKINLKEKMTANTTPSTNMNEAEPIKRKKKGGKFFKLLFLVVLAGLVYSQYELYNLKNPAYQQKEAQAKVNQVIKQAGKLIILPKGDPQVVTIQDADKLKQQQPFFVDAINNDVVLVYSTTAIIYSPSRNKIVNVGPVVKEDPTPAPQPVVVQPVKGAKTIEKSTTTNPAANKAN